MTVETGYRQFAVSNTASCVPSHRTFSDRRTYEASDWAAVGGGGSLDLQAEATFKRGIDLALGAEALVGPDASVAKFLARSN